MKRRDFLGFSTLAGASALSTLAGTNKAFANTATQVHHKTGNVRPLGYAVLGLGKFATEQALPAFEFSKYAKLVAVISGSAEKAKKYATQYRLPTEGPRNGALTYNDLDTLKNRPDIDVVYVITPNYVHKKFAVPALQMGKHVLCEKPLAASEADCIEMIAAADKAGLHLMTAYRTHFDPITVSTVERLRRGELGDVQMIQTAHMQNLMPYKNQSYMAWRLDKARSGYGALGDIGIYGINASRYLSGKEPVKVSGHYIKKGTSANVAMSWNLFYADGSVAQGVASFDSSPVNMARITGTKETLSMNPCSTYYDNESRFSKNGVYGTDKIISQSWLDRSQTSMMQFANMLDELPLAMAMNRHVKNTGQEGLRDVQLVAAIARSADQNGATIDVSQGADWATKIYGKGGFWNAWTPKGVKL